jgi:hypothetical protein
MTTSQRSSPRCWLRHQRGDRTLAGPGACRAPAPRFALGPDAATSRRRLGALSALPGQPPRACVPPAAVGLLPATPKGGAAARTSWPRTRRRQMPAAWSSPSLRSWSATSGAAGARTKSRCRACRLRPALVSDRPPTATTTAEWGRGADSSALRESPPAAPAGSVDDCLPPSLLNRNGQQPHSDLCMDVPHRGVATSDRVVGMASGVVLVNGLPGSGKTTLAVPLARAWVLSCCRKTW